MGCARCREGYAGRVGLFQVMPISDSMKNMMLQHTHAAALAEQAKREGIATLREDGLDKVRQGLTTLAEVEQATHD